MSSDQITASSQPREPTQTPKYALSDGWSAFTESFRLQPLTSSDPHSDHSTSFRSIVGTISAQSGSIEASVGCKCPPIEFDARIISATPEAPFSVGPLGSRPFVVTFFDNSKPSVAVRSRFSSQTQVLLFSGHWPQIGQFFFKNSVYLIF